MKPATFERLAELRAAATPVALLTNLRSGSQLLVTAGGSEGELCLDVDMVAAAQEALKSDESTSFETPAGKVFVHVFAPPPRLVVVGAVHIAEPLARMGALSGYGVTIVDPRRAFAASQRFDGIAVSGDWPDEAMEKLRPDMRTAVVTLTHDPKLDDPALDVALKSPAFYIGALGSRKTHAARLQRLSALGHGEAALARIHGPVGLDIGALSPAEIALSIMGQVTAVRRGGGTRR
ncbi:MAG: xanthine dehydrogenase [Alphaproteobacteria bacterium]|nr:xanthine dehydrogenase [Alphaproteobacteria bacterium]